MIPVHDQNQVHREHVIRNHVYLVLPLVLGKCELGHLVVYHVDEEPKHELDFVVMIVVPDQLQVHQDRVILRHVIFVLILELIVHHMLLHMDLHVVEL